MWTPGRCSQKDCLHHRVRLMNDVIRSGRQLYVGIRIRVRQTIFGCSIGLCQSYTQPTWEYVGLAIRKHERRLSRRMFRLTLHRVPCNGYLRGSPGGPSYACFSNHFKIKSNDHNFPKESISTHNIFISSIIVFPILA